MSLLTKRDKANQIILICFCIVQIIIWITLNALSLPFYFRISYLSIIYCFLANLFFLQKNIQSYLQLVASFFTCIADFFLILLKARHKTLAMFVFLCVQLTYAIRIYLLAEFKKEKIIQITLRACLSVLIVIIAFLVLKQLTSLLVIVSVIYYINLLISLVYAFIYIKKQPFVKFMAIGLLFFALCDVSIGMYALVDILSLGEGNLIYEIVNSPIQLDRIFYLPSQVMLVLSGMANCVYVFLPQKKQKAR